MEAVQIQLREVGIELELEETDWVAKSGQPQGSESPWLSLRHPTFQEGGRATDRCLQRW